MHDLRLSPIKKSSTFKFKMVILSAPFHLPTAFICPHLYLVLVELCSCHFTDKFSQGKIIRPPNQKVTNVKCWSVCTKYIVHTHDMIYPTKTEITQTNTMLSIYISTWWIWHKKSNDLEWTNKTNWAKMRTFLNVGWWVFFKPFVYRIKEK